MLIKRHGHDVNGLITLGNLTQVILPFKVRWFLYLPPYLISIGCISRIMRQAYPQQTQPQYRIAIKQVTLAANL
jgi:hypothetical protein